MDNSNFSFGLGVERYLRSALPYGGLPSKDSPQMAFFDAASEGDLPRMRELASGRDAEGKAWLADVCIAGGGPFQTAARLGKLDAVRCMVEELGFDVNAGSQEGITALDAATMDERMDVMRYLLDHGADPNKRANSGFVPLHCAARKGRDEAAKLLLSSGASVDIAFSDGTPLHFAAACGTIGVMKVLLEHNADVKRVKNTKVQLKSYGEKAVQRKDYDGAAMFYTEAIELDPTDATLYSNRSLCHLEMTEAEKALKDANTCIRLRPEWKKGHYRKGAALMLLKDYKKACDAFMVGLQLDPGNAEMEKAFRVAVEAMKTDHLARKGLKPSS